MSNVKDTLDEAAENIKKIDTKLKELNRKAAILFLDCVSDEHGVHQPTAQAINIFSPIMDALSRVFLLNAREQELVYKATSELLKDLKDQHSRRE